MVLTTTTPITIIIITTSPYVKYSFSTCIAKLPTLVMYTNAAFE